MTSKKSGHSYYSSGLLEELCEENRKKLEADPKNVSIRNNLAKALLKLGKIEDAIRELETCVKVDGLPQHWNNLGKALVHAGKYEGALKAFQEVLSRGCKWPDTFFHFGLAHRGRGDLENANASLLEAIALNPRYREALNQRAEILEALNRKDEALLEYKKVIALFFAEYQFNEPSNFKYDLSVLFDNPGLLDEVIRRLEDFSGKYPGFADIQYKLGQALEAKGRHDEAVIAFRRALEINPRFDLARKSFWKRS